MDRLDLIDFAVSFLLVQLFFKKKKKEKEMTAFIYLKCRKQPLEIKGKRA